MVSVCQSFEKAREKLKSKHKHLDLVEYNGYYSESTFIDSEYGKFSGRFGTVLGGFKSHPDRMINTKNALNFTKAYNKLRTIHPHLELVEFSGTSKTATVLDLEYGVFSGVYNNILLEKKQHKDRIKEKRFCLSKERVKNKYPYLELLSYNGVNGVSKFLDSKYGEFEERYSAVFDGRKQHLFRAKSKYFNLVSEKKNHLTLLDIDLKTKIGKYLDSQYGEFSGNFYKVLGGDKNHPKRSNLNKKISSQKKCVKEKRKNTCLKRYGKKATFIDDNRVLNINGLSGKDEYNRLGLDFSYSKFLKLLKIVGYDSAVNFKSHKTDIETIIEVILNNLGEEFVFNKKLKCLNYKPDFVIRDYLIIEADGLMYHSDLYNNDKKYHKTKHDNYVDNGYLPLFFRSDEIIGKTEIVQSIIESKLGISKNKIYARKCEVVKDKKSSHYKEWFQKNHLMGNGSGRVYSLTYSGKTVACMSIVKKKTHIEVSRFSNLLNTTVVGGFSKLLKQFVIDLNPSEVVSFVDMRYGNGQSLEKLGFVEKSNYMSFKWTDFNKTYHRMKYKSNSGYDFNMHKIWDCGQKRFSLKINRKI